MSLMVRCAFCKAKEAERFEYGVPICHDCFNIGKPKSKQADHLEISGPSPDIAGLLAIIVLLILMKSFNQLN